MYSKEDMIKLPGSLLCAIALMIHAFGAINQESPRNELDTYRKLIISCARNNYTNNIKNFEKTEPPQDTKNGNPAQQNDQSGCVHSGTAAVVTTPQRFKRLNGKDDSCNH